MCFQGLGSPWSHLSTTIVFDYYNINVFILFLGGIKVIEKLLRELKQYMINSSLTQTELARLLQVNQPQISRLFSGARQPSAKMIDKIEQLLQEEKNDY